MCNIYTIVIIIVIIMTLVMVFSVDEKSKTYKNKVLEHQELNIITQLTSYTCKRPKATRSKLLGFKICINNQKSTHLNSEIKSKNQTNTNEKGRREVTFKMVTTTKSTNNMCIKGKRGGREGGRRRTTTEGRE